MANRSYNDMIVQLSYLGPIELALYLKKRCDDLRAQREAYWEAGVNAGHILFELDDANFEQALEMFVNDATTARNKRADEEVIFDAQYGSVEQSVELYERYHRDLKKARREARRAGVNAKTPLPETSNDGHELEYCSACGDMIGDCNCGAWKRGRNREAP